ncbi:ATP-dependent Clp protease proteolytic subunit [Streptomyces changanensis]
METPMDPTSRHVLPEFTERTAWGTRTLDPYAKLLEGRIVLIGTPLDATTANDVIAQLVHLEYAAPDQDVSLYINSPGGPFDAMTAVYDAMQVIACDVATTCVGQAASTAALLLAAGAPGKRAALPGARVVLRQPALDEPLRGRPSDLEVHAHEVLRQREFFTGLLVRHTGRDRDLVEADLDRDLVLDATGARAHGLVDDVVPGRRS